MTSGCFTRKLLESGLDDEKTGEAISSYLTHLNRSIQTYFSAPDEFMKYAPGLEKEYVDMLQRYIL